MKINKQNVQRVALTATLAALASCGREPGMYQGNIDGEGATYSVNALRPTGRGCWLSMTDPQTGDRVLISDDNVTYRGDLFRDSGCDDKLSSVQINGTNFERTPERARMMAAWGLSSAEPLSPEQVDRFEGSLRTAVKDLYLPQHKDFAKKRSGK